MARQQGFGASEINAGAFQLYSMAPNHWSQEKPLTVYVEGDGHAWANRYRLSDDPTPKDPVGLKLALRDSAPNLVYIARPCQYVQGPSRRNCNPAFWSTARFHDSVVVSLNAAIDHYKRLSGAATVRLVGFSGGGTLVLLAAARRSDVGEVVTVSAVLDTATWTRLLGDSPLADSLNPIDFTQALSVIPQRHYQGSDDKIVPSGVAQSYLSRFPAGQRPSLTVVSGQEHECCWADIWPLAGGGR